MLLRAATSVRVFGNLSVRLGDQLEAAREQNAQRVDDSGSGTARALNAQIEKLERDRDALQKQHAVCQSVSSLAIILCFALCLADIRSVLLANLDTFATSSLSLPKLKSFLCSTFIFREAKSGIPN